MITLSGFYCTSTSKQVPRTCSCRARSTTSQRRASGTSASWRRSTSPVSTRQTSTSINVSRRSVSILPFEFDFEFLTKSNYRSNYSQTWASNHLWITTTCLQQPQCWGLFFNLYSIKLPLNNDHLSTTATYLGFRLPSWLLYTGVTVYNFLRLNSKVIFVLQKAYILYINFQW